MMTRFLAFFFAHWHLRRLPEPEDGDWRRARLRWCRDNCLRFAGRWFAVGIGAWLLLGVPFLAVLFPGPLAWIPVLLSLLGISLGIFHMAWQIIAQSRVGLPPIEPAVEVRPDRERRPRRYM